MTAPDLAPTPPRPDSDRLAFWLGQITLGDKSAFAALYEATSPYLMGVAMRVLKRRERAEEVLQEAYVNVWRGAAGFAQTEASPMSWLIAIVRHKALDHLRNTQHSDRHASLDDEADGSAGVAHQMASDAPDPMAMLSAASEQHGIRLCLDTLDAPLRQSLALAYYEGLSHGEVARHMRAPLGTVKSWLSRGVLRLRACLERAVERPT